MVFGVMEYKLPEELKGTILEQIMNAKVREIAGAKSKLPASALRMAMDRAPEVRSLKRALSRHSPAVIAEIKKASPSAGILRPDCDPAKIAREYQASGAAAISVVTEVQNFQGGLEILAALRWTCEIPLLRKDFLVDLYQISESRLAGADAVLLIAALTDIHTLKRLREEAEALGMEALVEVHNERELDGALESGATIVGVNNRDLRTFEVSLDVSMRLSSRLPKDVLAVAESGIRTASDIKRLIHAGYRGFLIGEQLMQAPSPGAALAELMRA